MRAMFHSTAKPERAAYYRMRIRALAFALVLTGPFAAQVGAASINVPVNDQHDMRKEVVRSIAAHASDDALVAVVYGTDPALLSEVKRAVRDAHLKGMPARGVVLGTASEPRSVDIYADGILIGTHSNPGPHIYNQTMQTLAYGASLLKHELSNR